ncbi:MAG TPA: hypothetical protein VGO47_04430 [Chlamydiales bacterium]|nr:hypothetical protein [Chlamydiales bacterium]
MSCFFSSEAVANLPGKNHFLKRIHKVGKKISENWVVLPHTTHLLLTLRSSISGALTLEIISRIFETDY